MIITSINDINYNQIESNIDYLWKDDTIIYKWPIL